MGWAFGPDGDSIGSFPRAMPQAGMGRAGGAGGMVGRYSMG